MPSTLSDRVRHIRELIAADRLGEALRALSDLAEDVAPDETRGVTLSLASHARVERQSREGTITREERDVQLNRLTQATLTRLEELERRREESERRTPRAAKERVDFGILTMREDENTAVLDRFPEQLRTVDGHRRYRLRRLSLSPTEAYTVAVLRCAEQGNGEAQAAARDLLEDLSPAWILVVGIAGGVPAHELSLGDVIVSTRIVDFSVEAVLKDHSREYALAGGPLHPEASALAADIPAMAHDGELGDWNTEASIGRPTPPVILDGDPFYGPEAWKTDVREKIQRRFAKPRAPLVTTGAIASSDRLIKEAEILEVWLKMARQVQAVEMESAGVYRATHAKQVPFLSIRGISDVVGFKRHPDWTTYACHTAAAFTRAFLLARPVAPRGARAD